MWATKVKHEINSLFLEKVDRYITVDPIYANDFPCFAILKERHTIK